MLFLAFCDLQVFKSYYWSQI